MFRLKEKGDAVEIAYPTEGTPLIIGPNGVFRDAPNPNAAPLFQSYCLTPERQQLIVDVGGLRSVHPLAKEKPGRRLFAGTKKMQDDPAGVERDADAIKACYTQLFRV